jgi:hypothetical protein
MASNGFFHTLARKESVGSVQPVRYTTIQRAAASLSRLNVDQATTELINEAHSRLITLCYQRDDTGHLVNVDAATGKILIPLPWGKAGHAKWGLTPSEGDAFRRIIFNRQRHGVPLFFFDRSRRAWYIDLVDHPVLPVVGEWDIAVNEYREARAEGGTRGGAPGRGGGGGK